MKDRKREEYLNRVTNVLDTAMRIVMSSDAGSKEAVRANKLFARLQQLRNQLNVVSCPLNTVAVSNIITSAERSLENIQTGKDDTDGLKGLDEAPEIDKDSIAGRMIDELEDGQKCVIRAYSLAIKDYPHLAHMAAVQALKSLEMSFSLAMKTLIKELAGLPSVTDPNKIEEKKNG